MSGLSRLTETNSTGIVSLKNNYIATTAPSATDDSASGYAVGSVWIDVTADERYVCLDATATSAVWNKTTVGTATEVVNTPAGAVASTNVQGAINELDTEKGTKAQQDTNTTAIALNTAKVGITSGQASAITANTSKVGITTTQANDITANNAKVGVTTEISSLLEDANPKLGGNLDKNGKRINPNLNTIVSSATPTPVSDTTDVFTVTALALGATFGAPTGTPIGGQKLIIRIKDNAISQTLAWNAIYRASTDLALPTATVISKTMYLGFMYNSTDSKWDLLAFLDNI